MKEAARILLIVCLLAATHAWGFGPSADSTQFDPSVLKIKEDDYLGKTAPNISMTDDKGNAITLSKYAGKPFILSIIYYRCAQSCPVLNEGLATALKDAKLRLGEDYNVITLSFDGRETPADAQKFRNDLRIKMKGTLPESFDKWVFAVTTDAEAKRFTDAIGYRFFYSTLDKVFVHPNVYIFLSPEGKVMRYLFGLYPLSMDVRLALIEAADGKVGKFPVVGKVALACYTYDTKIGGYRINMIFILETIGFVFAIFTAVIVFLYSRKLKKQRRAEVLSP
ncbi:SCO family protein [Candidatus Magnetominusculus dajiuhuensis]|uniref:SCO family protein n=1 Tax=Candidatus Magnetominusculus dajiuhuensis TaxID=3137712 RepID=UPI0019ED1EE1|nr:SCO family protein [Nitrospirota bacterium]